MQKKNKFHTLKKSLSLKRVLLISDRCQNVRKIFLDVMEYISDQRSPKFTTEKVTDTLSNIGS